MRPLSISAKIWLSLGILVFGYFVSMVYGFISGLQTETRLEIVSEYLFPAAAQSQRALIAFNEQISMYEDFLQTGEEAYLQSAHNSAEQVQNALQTITSCKKYNDILISEIGETKKKLKEFTKEAQSAYAQMGLLEDDIFQKNDDGGEALLKKAFVLAELTQQNKAKLDYFKTEFADRLNSELEDVKRITVHQRYLSLIVFWVVVTSALSMIAIIISRSVIAPLKKTLMLEKAVEQSVDGIAVNDRDGNIRFVNQAWAEMHGYKIDEIKHGKIELFHTPEQYREELEPFNDRALAKGAHKGEVGHRKKDGTMFPAMRAINILKDENEKEISLVSFARDITERKVAEEALRKSEEKYKILTEEHKDVVLRISQEGILEYCSPAITDFGGYDPDHETGNFIEKYFLNESEFNNAIEIFEVVFTENNSATLEFLFKPVNKDPFYVEVTGTPVVEEKRVKAIQCVMRDISDRKKVENELNESLENLKSTQTQLVQSEKMAALGGLVAGVAHEINTPLGVGITAASLLSDKTAKYGGLYDVENLKRSDLEKYLKVAKESTAMILTNLNRAAELVRSFKQVAVDQSSRVRRVFNLKRYIDDLLFSLKPKYKRTHHAIVVNCPEDLEVDSYPGALSQIITNLVMNSLVHGFDGIDDGEIVFNIWVEDDWLVFCYTDNGKGMDTDTMERIYDPFFTTNRSSGGTGLGMHIMYNLVTQTLKGSLDLLSTPGEGVVFLTRFPLNAETDYGNGVKDVLIRG